MKYVVIMYIEALSRKIQERKENENHMGCIDIRIISS